MGYLGVAFPLDPPGAQLLIPKIAADWTYLFPTFLPADSAAGSLLSSPFSVTYDFFPRPSSSDLFPSLRLRTIGSRRLLPDISAFVCCFP